MAASASAAPVVTAINGKILFRIKKSDIFADVVYVERS
jgi:hypothetical protein